MLIKAKRIVTLVLIFIFTCTIFPGTSSAKNSDSVTVEQAKRNIIFQIIWDMKSNEKCPWRGKIVKLAYNAPIG